MATPENRKSTDTVTAGDRQSSDERKPIKDLSPQPRETEHVKGGIPKQGNGAGDPN